jgi:hypothetical protein
VAKGISVLHPRDFRGACCQLAACWPCAAARPRKEAGSFWELQVDGLAQLAMK